VDGGLAFRVLGPLEVLRDDRVLPPLDPRSRDVLCLLLVQRGEVVSVDRLSDALWSGEPPHTAVKVVQNAVSRIRRALGDRSGERIRTVERGYMLAVEPASLDSEQFAAGVADGRALLAEGDAPGAARRLRGALSLWRGDPFGEAGFAPYLRAESERLEELRRSALEDRIDADLASGSSTELVPELEMLVEREPWRERLRGQLALALYRSDRQVRALEVLTDGRRQLDRDLGLEPSPALRELERAILAHDPALGPRPAPRLRRHGWRRDRATAAVAAVLAVAAAITGLAWLDHGSGPAGAAVSGNAVASVDPQTGRIEQVAPVGQTPTTIVAGGSFVWALNADDGTISRIDPTDGAVTSRSAGVTPSGIGYGDGRLWVVSLAARGGSADQAVLVPIEPSAFRPGTPIRLPVRGEDANASGGVAVSVAHGAVWLAVPDRVLRVDARDGKVTVAARVRASSLAPAASGVWAATDEGLAAIRPGVPVRTIAVPTARLGAVAAGAGAVWITDPLRGLVWRVDPGPPERLQSVQVGLSADAVAVDGRSVWVSSGLDGTLVRVDGRTGAVLQRLQTEQTPQGIAVASKRLWLGLAPGSTTVPAAGPVGQSPLASPTCAPLVSASGHVDAVLASDMPLDQADAPVTRPIVQAIVLTLREHGFRAGRYRVGYQSCDDSTAASRAWSPGKCASNMRRDVGAMAVVVVIGPLNSGCAQQQLAIARRAHLAVISPGASAPFLTRAASTFFRTFPPDDAVGTGLAHLLASRGDRRIALVADGSPTGGGYARPIEAALVRAARGDGARIVFSATPIRPTTRLDMPRLASSHPDAIALVGFGEAFSPHLVADVRRVLPRATVVTTDAIFSAGKERFGPALNGGLVVSGIVNDPEHQLPDAGRRFTHRLAAVTGTGDTPAYAPYAAAATEVALAAIADAGTTRIGVLAALHGATFSTVLGDVGFSSSGDPVGVPLPVFRTSLQARVPPGLPPLEFAEVLPSQRR
jgi:DNA-binding SARP family transcriptional activator/ABC-type branched-subunit amino acid transport system substrate-binding protein